MATRSGPGEPFANPRRLDDVNNHERMLGMTFITSPEISADDLELFFCAQPARGAGYDCNVYVATRGEASGLFTDVEVVADISLSGIDEHCPSLSGDQLTLFWSDFDLPHRPGGQGADIWMASRLSTLPTPRARTPRLPMLSGRRVSKPIER